MLFAQNSGEIMISNCNIESDDDSIVFKSIDGETCENVTVSNYILSSRCQAIKFGTESFIYFSYRHLNKSTHPHLAL
jgi:polygalacturonase